MNITTEIVQLPLESIRTDGGTQPRAALDQNVIQEYAQDMLLGATFPPTIVFYDGSDYWLADGFHRYHGAKQICRESIDAEVKQGTRRDAVLYSVGTNAAHGLRRTNEDKHRAVETLLKDAEWSKWSDREIARRCGVHNSFVSRLRPSLSFNDSETRTIITKHCTESIMNTSNIGQHQNLTLQEIANEVLPVLTPQQREERAQWLERWQKDNIELGLDKWANPLPPVEETGKEEEDESKEDFNPRYYGSKPARCKYCYQTHNDWKLGGDYDGIVWECQNCFHATRDAFMQIEDGELSEEQKTFHRRYSNIFPSQQEKNNESDTQSVLPIPSAEETCDTVDAKEKRDAHVMSVMGSSDSPEWYTPQEIIDLACQMFGTIDTDPCSNSHETPAVPAHTLYTKDDDGLSKKWTGKTYLNPPYGAEISKWTDKLVTEYKAGNVTEALALLPARIDTVWFSPLYEYVMCNVKGRIQFANSPYHAPFPCVIVYLGTHLNDFIEVFKNLGPIMRRIA